MCNIENYFLLKIKSKSSEPFLSLMLNKGDIIKLKVIQSVFSFK